MNHDKNLMNFKLNKINQSLIMAFKKMKCEIGDDRCQNDHHKEVKITNIQALCVPKWRRYMVNDLESGLRGDMGYIITKSKYNRLGDYSMPHSV